VTWVKGVATILGMIIVGRVMFVRCDIPDEFYTNPFLHVSIVNDGLKFPNRVGITYIPQVGVTK